MRVIPRSARRSATASVLARLTKNPAPPARIAVGAITMADPTCMEPPI
jgi:hypothetical protein